MAQAQSTPTPEAPVPSRKELFTGWQDDGYRSPVPDWGQPGEGNFPGNPTVLQLWY